MIPSWISYVLAVMAYLILVSMDAMWTEPVTETDEKTGETWVTYEHRWSYKKLKLYRSVAFLFFLAATVCAIFT